MENKVKPLPLTAEQKEAIRLNMCECPHMLSSKINAPFSQIRNYQGHMRRRHLDQEFNLCPITGYKKY